MDASETLVKERFDAAVGGITPDVTSLVGGGISAGRGIRRRRRLMGAGAAAATAAAVGTVALTGGLGSTLGSLGPEPAGRTLSQLEPATPRGLAAAVMAHTDGVGTLVGVGAVQGRDDGGKADSQGPDLTATIAYRTPAGTKLELDVFAVSPLSRVQRSNLCRSLFVFKGCTEKELADGTKRFVFRSSKTGHLDGPGYPLLHVLGVAIVRDDQVVSVNETVVNSASDPLSVADLQAIAADPAVGVWTTAALNDAGLEITDFQNSLGLSSGSSASSSGGGTSTTASAGPPHRVHGSASGPN